MLAPNEFPTQLASIISVSNFNTLMSKYFELEIQIVHKELKHIEMNIFLPFVSWTLISLLEIHQNLEMLPIRLHHLRNPPDAGRMDNTSKTQSWTTSQCVISTYRNCHLETCECKLCTVMIDREVYKLWK